MNRKCVKVLMYQEYVRQSLLVVSILMQIGF
jgi:hypothetical protein